MTERNDIDICPCDGDCPIGKALAGHRVGDLVTVMVENQKGVMISSYKLKILSVERKEKSEPHV